MTKVKFIFFQLVVIVILSIPAPLQASPQIPDYVIFNGDTIPIYRLILEEYFEYINKANEGELFELKFRSGSSMNCWRGYQAIYEIDNDSLFLTHILLCNEIYNGSEIDEEQSIQRIKKIFGERLVNRRVFMSWYSGDFSLPDGELLRWDGVFYRSFENEVLISFKNGNLIDKRKVVNYLDDPDRINRRFRDTLTNILFKELDKVQWKNVDKFDCSEKYTITIDTKGEINDISMTEFQARKKIRKFWDRREYNYCIKKIKKTLKHLKFDILKQEGIPVTEYVYIDIWFNSDGTLENWTNN